jgi:hypothetical protein
MPPRVDKDQASPPIFQTRSPAPAAMAAGREEIIMRGWLLGKLFARRGETDDRLVRLKLFHRAGKLLPRQAAASDPHAIDTAGLWPIDACGAKRTSAYESTSRPRVTIGAAAVS